MTYTTKLFPRDETQFPPPPPWLLWRGEARYDRATGSYIASSKEGQVRHHDSLEVAKKNIYGWGGTFSADWAIYEWNHQRQRYELRYEGKADGDRSAHPLFQRGAIKKTGKGGKAVRQVTDEDMSEVLASLQEVLT